MNQQKITVNESHSATQSGFIGLIVSMILIFLFLPLFTESYYVPLAFRTFFSIIILSTIFTISQKNRDIFLGMAIVIPFIIIECLSIKYNSVHLMMIAYVFYSAFLIFALMVLIKRMLEMAMISSNLVFGAIAIYLLTGILWGKLYFLVESFHPNSFHGIQNQLKTHELLTSFQNEFDLMYYSFGTLTTLGIGDITPLHHVAKSLTVFEAMFGQLFTATFIAKFVSIWHHPLPKEKRSANQIEK